MSDGRGLPGREALDAIRARWEAVLPHADADGMPCPGCLAAVGRPHEMGCDWERCPHCGEQSIVCGNCQGETAADALPGLLDLVDALMTAGATAEARVARLEAALAALCQVCDGPGDTPAWPGREGHGGVARFPAQ